MKDKIYNKDRKELITLIQAEKLNLGKVSALKKRILTGKMNGIKVGRDWLITKDDVRKQSKN